MVTNLFAGGRASERIRSELDKLGRRLKRARKPQDISLVNRQVGRILERLSTQPPGIAEPLPPASWKASACPAHN